MPSAATNRQCGWQEVSAYSAFPPFAVKGSALYQQTFEANQKLASAVMLSLATNMCGLGANVPNILDTIG